MTTVENVPTIQILDTRVYMVQIPDLMALMIHWIEADWPAATLGLTQAHFQMDLHEPTRWQSIYEQPDIRFWDPITNNYNASWSSNDR